MQFSSGSGWIPLGNTGILATPGSISGNGSPCMNSTGNIYSVSLIQNATGYYWTVTTGATISSGQGTSSVTVSFGNNNGMIGVAAYNDRFRSSMNSIGITLIPTAAVKVSISASANPVCSGTPVTFATTPGNGGALLSYQWMLNGLPIGGATNATYSFIPASNDAVKCILTSNLVCTSGNPATSNMITITVNSPPAPAGPISGISAWCSNGYYLGETGYHISHIPGATGYVWIVPYGTVIISGQGTSGIVTNAPPGMGIFSVYGTNQCGTGSASYLQVSMYPPPYPTITGPASVCQLSIGNVYTTQPGMSSYAWIISAGGIKTSGGTPNDNTVTVTWNTTGNKTVKVNYNNMYGCSGSNYATANVTVNPLLPVSVSITASANQSTAGVPVSFTATAVNGGTSPAYQWIVNGNNVGLNAATFSYVPSNNGSIVCVLTSDLACVSGNPGISNEIVMGVN
jgi:hypothetical protein